MLFFSAFAEASAPGMPVQVLDEWRAFLRTTDQPPFAVVTSTLDPHTGDRWFATWGGGLVRYSAGRFGVFNQFNSGLAGDLVFDLCIENDRVWAATIGGVSVYSPATDEWSLHFPRTASGSHPVWTRVLASDGLIYVATADGRGAKYDAKSDRWENTRPPVSKKRQPPLAKISPVKCAEEETRAIAVYGPRNKTIQLPGAAQIRVRPQLAAVESALALSNRLDAGSVGTIELLKVSTGYERYGWTLPEDDVAIFAMNPRVLGIVGQFSPKTDPVLREVVARTGIAFVTTATLQPGDHRDLLATPNAFECLGHLKRAHRLFVKHLAESTGAHRMAVVNCEANAGMLRLGWWSEVARGRGIDVVEWSPTAQWLSHPELIATWTDAESTVQLVEEIRRAGITSLIAVGPACLREDLATLSSVPLGDLVAFDEAALPPAPLLEPFASEFERIYSRHRFLPGPASRSGHDAFNATDHLLDAVHRGNASRESVARELAEMRESPNGEKHFDEKHVMTPVPIAEFSSGKWSRRNIAVE